MENLKAYYYKLEGTNYEIGKILGNRVKKYDKFKATVEDIFSDEEKKYIIDIFDKYAPGINEEIEGFAEALGIDKFQVIYYTMSFLKPRCSQLLALPKKTENNHILLARNYEFSEKTEELVLCTTKVKGKYAHIGSSIINFGRCDGINEHGLAISQTSAGIPVGNIDILRKPKIVGLQFWAVIRTILENCKNVNEAVDYFKEVPIAYNINLIIADKKGNAVLMESLDGRKEFKEISNDTEEQVLYSTNHIHLEGLKEYEPKAMKNSIVRYDLISKFFEEKEKINEDDIKNLLSKKYPEGLCCHYYDEFFGTLRGMIFNLSLGTVEVCFGSTKLNNWHKFKIDNENDYIEYLAKIKREKSPEDFYLMIDNEL